MFFWYICDFTYVCDSILMVICLRNDGASIVVPLNFKDISTAKVVKLGADPV